MNGNSINYGLVKKVKNLQAKGSGLICSDDRIQVKALDIKVTYQLRREGRKYLSKKREFISKIKLMNLKENSKNGNFRGPDKHNNECKVYWPKTNLVINEKDNLFADSNSG